MNQPASLLLIVAGLAGVATVAHSTTAPAPGLQPVGSFATIKEPAKRSIALFTEAGKVIQHPRCLNCHPVTAVPTQGDDLRPHMPPMTRGASNHGPAGLACATCHGSENVRTSSAGIKSIPGNAHWGLAPREMGWQRLSLGAICAQIKDPKRNGSRSLAQITTHMRDDHLVGWAWHPGEGRTSPPGSQVEFGKLIAAWVETGAHCPPA